MKKLNSVGERRRRQMRQNYLMSLNKQQQPKDNDNFKEVPKKCGKFKFLFSV